MQIKKATKKDFDAMANLWEDSVASTYDFLRMKEIASLKKIIKEKYFPNPEISYYVLKDQDDKLLAFSGVIDKQNKIEFLFVSPNEFGKGYGKKLLVHLLKKHRAIIVDVHKQNMHALAFYTTFGYETVGQVDKDIFGNSYPVLHLKLTGDINKAIEKIESTVY